MDKKPITPEGHKRLKDELDYIKNIKRQDIIDAISEARAHGDLKENAEYHACLLYTSPSPRDLAQSRMPSSA